MYQDAFPRSIFFCSALAEWYIIPSSMPATVNTPPTMAHTPVRKCVKDRLCSVSWTIMGLRSYMKNTPVTSQRKWCGYKELYARIKAVYTMQSL